MAQRGPIPTRDTDFNTYINNAINYMVANAGSLGITAGTVTELQNKQANWNALFPQSQNPALRTSAITDQKNNLREEIEDLLRDVYSNIREADLNEAARNALNLPERDDEPTPRPAITTAPHVDLKAGSGARIEVTLRVESDADRASRHEHADSIELCYKIGDPGPNSPADCNKTVMFTRALHTLKLDIADAGQRFYCYVKWKNTSNDEKSGPWSNMSSIVITD